MVDVTELYPDVKASLSRRYVAFEGAAGYGRSELEGEATGGPRTVGPLGRPQVHLYSVSIRSYDASISH